MELKILHIDDEPDILERVAKVVTGSVIEQYTLNVIDSCGFDEGMQKLETTEYDLVILDLCIGKASSASDKVGETVFQQIQKRAFIPVIFFTGLPEYVKPLESDIVRIVGKGSGGYDGLFGEIGSVIASKFIELKKEVNGVIKEGVRDFFWNFVHPHSKIISDLRKDDVSLKYLLLRRLGRTLSSELTRSATDDPQFKREHSHPMEFYIFPPVDGEYETGDIVINKKTKEVSVVLTPSCDLVTRSNGKRKADRILLVHALQFKSIPDFVEWAGLRDKEAKLRTENKELTKDEASKLKNKKADVIRLMGTGSERHFFLPQTPFLEASLIDFQNKSTITYEELDQMYELVASIDDPISQALLAKYTRYYSRVGYQDLDTEYALSKII